MRKSKQETAETRKRIIQAAASEFRREGLNGVGLSEIMAAAGLTHGGFYRHFDSKDQLITEAITTDFITEALNAIVARDTEKSGLESIVTTYLSPRHRDNRARGCPLSALGSELARSDESTRIVATESFLKIVAVLAKQYKKVSPAVARQKAIVAVVTMIGAMTMSRVVADPKLSATILEQASKHLILE